MSLGVVGVVGGVLFLGRSPEKGVTVQGTGREAPPFTLASTAGTPVSLSDYQGRNVLLYFSEGVGCDACFYQMVELEKNQATLDADGLTVLPVVVNPPADVQREMDRFGLKTPFLIDADETVSYAYGVVGTGMHANLPGHSFVLVGPNGNIRFQADYPSMFIKTSDLLSAMGMSS